MGTFVEVSSYDAKAAGIVFARIKRVESLLSKYDPASEISRLNREGKAKVSCETFFIINKARDFWILSKGAFDVTVGPLLDIWGFTDKKYHVPEEAEIKKALGRVGFDKVLLNPAENTVEFKVPGMKIDLGGIAKGYALDCAVEKLRQAGIRDCLINAGGQIYCLGDNSGSLWKIAVKDPRKNNFDQYLRLKDCSVATSGDYEQYFTIDNRRFSHIFDPRTGRPVMTGIRSVTVVARDGLTADALSTAVFVLGKEKGKALISTFPGAQASIIDKDG